MTSRGVAAIIIGSVTTIVVVVIMLIMWCYHDTPTHECWTPTHIELHGLDSVVYTSDGQRIDPNNHVGLLVEGRQWCGNVGHSIGAWLPWIEDDQGPFQPHTSG